MPTSRCVFVSHADEDKEVALVLKSLILKAAGKPIRVFVSSDLKDKRHGTDWMKRIGSELADTSAFVFLASPGSLRASWTNIEIGGALFSKPQPRIFPICIAGLTIPQLPSPSNRFDASNPGSADELRDVVGSIVRACKVPFSEASTVDWEAAYLAFCEAQEEWLTIDHEVFSACSSETLRYLEPILNVARSGQDAAGLYSDLIGHVLQTMTFHGSPIDDRFWVAHGNDIRGKQEWPPQKKLAYLVLAARQRKIVTGRKDSYGVMDVLRRQVSEYRATATDDELARPESQDFLFSTASPKVLRLFILRKGKDALADFTKQQLESLDGQMADNVEIRFLRWTRPAPPPNFGIYGDVAVGRLSPSGINEIEFDTETVKNVKRQFDELWDSGKRVERSDIETLCQDR
ncbi:toll/interleukin-1 receptor domain-containing protein [Bradyrhizobium sp. WSM 1704]|uniref:toll/interleukin-1 receptor domain-containing protein n=1 Tax=Bradyrhizobium semiaridum TaxID=2821404 RepID=UPI001CE2404E|nr:toll/interleukin-1 receptor domain-containing protein [Bradyrhizobium semiaridum]MCA6122106.1 toll/interleukin-1 receptor domain-containing protein [Bradyrhizobium semiaridum]